MVVPFALPLDDGVARIGGVTGFHTSLIVLRTYYSDVALEAIDGDSSFSEPAAVDIPYHKVEFIDRDEPTRLELSALLNATGNDQRLYSNYWRNPDFLVLDNVFNYVVVGANGLIILVVGVIFIYQQYKIRQIHAIILTMQAMLVPRVATLGVLVLRTTTVKNQTPGQSHVEILVQFGNNYWVIMVALIMGLLVVYKVFKNLRRFLPKAVGLNVTHTYLVLQVFNSEQTIYIRLACVDGIHSELTIRSEDTISHLVVIGYLFPTMTYVWSAALENNMTGVTTVPGTAVRVTLCQAWVLKRLIVNEYRTEMFLLTGDELHVVREESVMETVGADEDGLTGNLEYTLAGSQVLPTAPMGTNAAEGQIIVPPRPLLGRLWASPSRPSSPPTRPLSPQSEVVEMRALSPPCNSTSSLYPILENEPLV